VTDQILSTVAIDVLKNASNRRVPSCNQRTFGLSRRASLDARFNPAPLEHAATQKITGSGNSYF
jgi:hypothetical protein